MLINALTFLLGICIVQMLPVLPALADLYPLFISTGFCILLCFAPRFNGYIKYLGAAIFMGSGVTWSIIVAQSYLDARWPEHLAGRDVYIEGCISDIPLRRERVQSFIFQVQNIGHEEALSLSEYSRPGKLRLSWYQGRDVKSGQCWGFLVRLKPPHGFLNPGGFDYESWLYQNRIHATGYIRPSSDNRKLADPGFFSIDALRERITVFIQTTLMRSEYRGLISALSVGDRSQIHPHHWDILIKTGTNHLMAISGLHIGLAAVFGYWITRRVWPSVLYQRLPVQRLGIIVGLFLALGYALLAGMALPAQRALLMLLSISLAWLLSRSFSLLQALAMALMVILIRDPSSVLSGSLWFSFLAVVVIYYVHTGRSGQLAPWKRWSLIQVSIALALFPVSLQFFQQTSLIAPLANFILVPYVSFLIVPLILVAVLILPLSNLVSGSIFNIADSLLEWIWPLLEKLSSLEYAYWVNPSPDIVAMVVAIAGIMLLLAPAGFPGRWLGVLMIGPVLAVTIKRPEIGDYELNLLDVGQGLAIVVRTHQHALVFDTGDRFSDRFDTGKAVILPFLSHSGIKRVDKLIISHGDSDHIGGAASLLAVLPVSEVVGRDIELLDAGVKTACRKGQGWLWDGVKFEFLHPDRQYRQRNNRSCVLRISGKGGAVLITGDIEAEVEAKLVATVPGKLAADVLVVPHHGSKSSSSLPFIKAVNPELALFSAGYRNRYRLPNKEVVSRYRRAGAVTEVSGLSGAIKIGFSVNGKPLLIEKYRLDKRKYWNHVIPDTWR